MKVRFFIADLMKNFWIDDCRLKIVDWWKALRSVDFKKRFP